MFRFSLEPFSRSSLSAPPVLSIVSTATSALIPLVVGVAIDTFVFPSGGQTQWPPLLFAAVFAAAFIVPVLGEIIFLGLLYFLFHS